MQGIGRCSGGWPDRRPPDLNGVDLRPLRSLGLLRNRGSLVDAHST